MKARASTTQAGNTFVHVLLGLVVIAVIGFAGWRVVSKNEHKTTASTTGAVTASQPAASSQPLTTDSDNASLNTDITTLTTDQNQANSSLQSSNSSLNDQQSEIQVPTN